MSVTYHTYKIEKDYVSIYYFLKDNHFSERYITFLRKKMGNLRLNQKPVTIRSSLKTGDVLEVITDTSTRTSIMHCIIPLDIVYEDDHLLIVNKPSGLDTMPNRSHYSHNLSGAILHYMQPKNPDFTLHIVNRLDKDTAGIIVIAKDNITLQHLGKIEKTYIAICEGVIQNPQMIQGRIETCKDKNGINLQKRIISSSGKEAYTQITPIQHNNHHTLLRIQIIGGRTHQIRVHMASIGHPLLGDSLYGSKSTLLNHAALLCQSISFKHPFSEKDICISVPIPQIFTCIMSEIE